MPVIRHTMFVLFAVFALAGQKAMAKGGYNEKKPLDIFGFIGAEYAPVQDANMYGVASGVAIRVLGGFYLGFATDRTQGGTKNSFGHPTIPWDYHLTSGSLTLDSKLRIMYSPQMAIFLSCGAGFETIQLGGKIAYSITPQTNLQTLNYYETTSRNFFGTLRPGIELFVFGRLNLKANYDFLYGTPDFGEISRFEGFQFTAQVTLHKKHYGKPYGYFYWYAN